MKWKMNENSLFASPAALVVVDQFRHRRRADRRRNRVAARGVPDLRHGYRFAVPGNPGVSPPGKAFQAPSRPASRIRSPRFVQCRGSNFPAPSRRHIGGKDTASAPISGAAANFEITKEGRTALVNCKRWKVAQTGVGALYDLHAMKEARNAHECIYMAAGEITDNATCLCRQAWSQASWRRRARAVAARRRPQQESFMTGGFHARSATIRG